MPLLGAESWSALWRCVQPVVDGGFVGRGKYFVVAVGQRPAAWNQRPLRVKANGLELPLPTNQLQISKLLALAVEHTKNAVIERLKRQSWHCKNLQFTVKKLLDGAQSQCLRL